MPNRPKNILLIFAYPAIIAVALGLIIIFLLPPIFEKYKAEIVDHQNIYYNNHILFEDINMDGFSERISISVVNSNFSYVNFYDEKNALSNVWNIHGKVNNKSLSFCDFDNNQKKEIYLLSLCNDSLFLNKYIIDNKHHGHAARVFITTIPKHYEQPDYGASKIIHHDMDGDSYKETLFSVYGEYSIFPRKIFCHNWKTGTTEATSNSGVIFEDIKTIHSFRDNQTFLTGNNSTTNYITENDTIPYADDKAWLMVYNNDMELTFNPVPFKKQGTSIDVLPLKKKGEPYFIVLEKNHFDDKKASLYTYQKNGDTLTSYHHNDNNEKFIHIFKPRQLPENHFYAISEKGDVFEVDDRLLPEKKHHIEMDPNSFFYTLNIDNDGLDETIQWIPNEKNMRIYQSGYTNMIEIALPDLKSSQLSLTIKKAPGKNLLSVKDFNHWYLIDYHKNKAYFLKYILYVSVFIFIYLIVYAFQKSRIIRSLEKERTISRLKLMTLKNQVDPHFTLNALNAIGLSILKDQKQTSYNNLQRFSQLIRNTLTEADDVTRTLEEEMQFVKDYVSIMQMRYIDMFDYHFEFEEDIDMQIKVPKMIIQSFAENAINHGLRPKESKGNLRISIYNEENGIEITVEDDGIGRTNAALKNTENTGKGTLIITEYLDLFNRFNKEKISYKIQDLFENRKATGTRVIIYIPANYDYEIQ